MNNNFYKKADPAIKAPRPNVYYVYETGFKALIEDLKRQAATSKDPILSMRVQGLIREADIQLEKQDKDKISSKIEDQESEVSNIDDYSIVDVFKTPNVEEATDINFFKKNSKKEEGNYIYLTGKDLRDIYSFRTWVDSSGFKDDAGKPFDDQDFNFCYIFHHLYNRSRSLLGKSENKNQEKLFGQYQSAILGLIKSTKNNYHCIFSQIDPVTDGSDDDDTELDSNGRPKKKLKTDPHAINWIKLIYDSCPKSYEPSNIPLDDLFIFFNALKGSEIKPHIKSVEKHVDDILLRLKTLYDNLFQDHQRVRFSIIRCDSTFKTTYTEKIKNIKDAETAKTTIIDAINDFRLILDWIVNSQYGSIKELETEINYLKAASRAANVWVSSAQNFLRPAMLGITQ